MYKINLIRRSREIKKNERHNLIKTYKTLYKEISINILEQKISENLCTK